MELMLLGWDYSHSPFIEKILSPGSKVEAKNNNQQLNDMGVIEDDGWHGGIPVREAIFWRRMRRASSPACGGMRGHGVLWFPPQEGCSR